jgi:hypothetical protein
MNKRDYELTAKVLRCANRGVCKSIELAKKKGVSNPFVVDGKLMYKKSDGTISSRA